LWTWNPRIDRIVRLHAQSEAYQPHIIHMHGSIHGDGDTWKAARDILSNTIWAATEWWRHILFSLFTQSVAIRRTIDEQVYPAIILQMDG